jgi:uncharacterized protein YdbL (DUF1318 family)
MATTAKQCLENAAEVLEEASDAVGLDVDGALARVKIAAEWQSLAAAINREG